MRRIVPFFNCTFLGQDQEVAQVLDRFSQVRDILCTIVPLVTDHEKSFSFWLRHFYIRIKLDPILIMHQLHALNPHFLAIDTRMCTVQHTHNETILSLSSADAVKMLICYTYFLRVKCRPRCWETDTGGMCFDWGTYVAWSSVECKARPVHRGGHGEILDLLSH